MRHHSWRRVPFRERPAYDKDAAMVCRACGCSKRGMPAPHRTARAGQWSGPIWTAYTMPHGQTSFRNPGCNGPGYAWEPF